MAKKRRIENWHEDVFLKLSRDGNYYLSFNARELVIVVASMLDLAIAQIIEARLKDDEDEIGSFLGLHGDGMSPLASFGARIQLAYLLGLYDATDMEMFRSIKKIRNYFAHKVNVSLTDTICVKELKKLYDTISDASNKLERNDSTEVLFVTLSKAADYANKEACAKLLLSVMAVVYQFKFSLDLRKIIRVSKMPAK